MKTLTRCGKTVVRAAGAALALLAWSGSPGARAEPYKDPRDEWQQPERVVRDLQLAPGATVADIGCGSGYFAFKLARAVGPKGWVQAVDIDANALANLRKEAKSCDLNNILATVSDPTDARLDPESVDVAFMCDVIHEVPVAQRIPLLKSVAKAVKPGGFFYLIDWRQMRGLPFDPYELLLSRETLVNLGEAAGLKLDGEFLYLRYSVFLRFRKPEAASAP